MTEDKKPDWAEAAVESLELYQDGDLTQTNYDDIKKALCKAKADGMREAARLSREGFHGSFLAQQLENFADKIEKGET